MTKTLFLAAVAVLLTAAAHAQKLKPAAVPAAAVAAFKAKFPTVKTNTWEKEDGKFEAGFRMNGTTMSAVITPAGELLETETDIAPAQLPAAVRASLARDYKAYKVTEAATLVAADGKTTYEAEISKGGHRHDVVFNADGSLVKK